MSPSTRAAAAAALRRQHKMTLERKVSDNAVSDTPLSTCTAGPGPNSDEYFGPLAGFTSTGATGAATPSLTAITANIATTSDRRAPPGTPGRGLARGVPGRLQPLTTVTGGGEEKGRRRESVAETGKKKGVWEHGRGRGEVSLDGEEAEVERWVIFFQRKSCFECLLTML